MQVWRHLPSHLALLYTLDSLMNYAVDFGVNWIEVRAVRRPQIWKFIRGDRDLRDYCTFGVEAANETQVFVKSQHAKKITATNIFKTDTVVSRRI